LEVTTTVRNIVIVLAIAALVVLVPGGGTGAQIAIQAVSLVFLGALCWFGALMYRQRRLDLYALGDRRRAILYIAIGVAAVTLTATHRMWHAGSLASVAWLVLIGGAVYAVVSIVLAARRY
jgi:hypothetical protein